MAHTSSHPFLCVTGIGLVTPLGADPALVLAAFKAGVSAYKSSNFCNQLRLPMTTTQVPEEVMAPISDAMAEAKLPSRFVRLIRLAMPAMKQAMASYADTRPIPLFLAGPEVLPNMAKPIPGNIIQFLLHETSLPIAAPKCRYIASGRTGLLEAIEMAFQCFAQTDENYILVGAVDSFIDAATLGQLDAEGRVLAEHVGDGFAPGEGAGFLLLCRPGLNDPELPAIYRPGLAAEPGHRYSDAPLLGQGLASAAKIALAQAPEHTVTDIFTTLNGESFSAKEFGVTLIRNASRFSANARLYHPADSFGDMGAALLPTLIVIAINNILANQPDKESQCIMAISDLGFRGAICLAKPASHT